MKCRHCHTQLTIPMIDLGSAPPSNAYLLPEQLNQPEAHFPLKVMVCEKCWLSQTLDFTSAESLFSAEYAYFSSFSQSWLEHSRRYVDDMVARFELDENSHVVEVASNDGYLLQYVQQRSISCTGIEPTASTAKASREKNIDTIEEFFGAELGASLAKNGKAADLTAANNVLAHVPDINDFLKGFSNLLKPEGVATFEFPHLMQLIEKVQFDTIYHEHFSYLSLIALVRIFARNGLQVFDVEEIPTHGGSLRVFACRNDSKTRTRLPSVDQMLEREKAAGLDQAKTYASFQLKSEKIKDDFVEFLINAKREGKSVAAYGAAAKGNTLMNFAGIRPDLISFVVDRNPAKQNKYMPGSRIPIVAEERLKSEKPDYIVILPWNLKTEVIMQLEYAREWNAKFVTAVPHLEVE